MNKKELKAAETKKKIISAAGKLFSERGYNAVTIREIAKEAGCSHTAIYLYFKDKDTLLHELSMPALHELKRRLVEIAQSEREAPEEKLKEISRIFVLYCLENENMYWVFLGANASRVDVEKPELEINKIRIELFQLLMHVIQECLLIEKNEQLLGFTRIFFYMLHGIVGTYSPLNESLSELMERLGDTFDNGVEILLIGFKEKMKMGDGGK